MSLVDRVGANKSSDTMLPIERVRHRRKETGGTHYTLPRQPMMKIFEHKSRGIWWLLGNRSPITNSGNRAVGESVGKLRTERYAGATVDQFFIPTLSQNGSRPSSIPRELFGFIVVRPNKAPNVGGAGQRGQVSEGPLWNPEREVGRVSGRNSKGL